MNLRSILEKSRKYPPEIMVRKVVHKGFILAQDYLRYVNDVVLGTELNGDDLYKKILTKKIERVSVDLSCRPLLSNQVKDKIIGEADKAKNHIFNLLGSGDVKVDYKLRAKGLEGYRYDMRLSDKKYLSIKEKIQVELEKIFQRPIEYEPIDWQVDFKSGYRWSEKTYYKFIKYGHKLGADIKLPWELSRAQHLLSLALAYRLAKKEEYAEEIIEQIVDWILTNSCRFGVNWRCTMDVAIRVTNWVGAISLIKNYIDNLPTAGKEHFYKIFYKSLYQHGEFIIHNLEWSEDLTSNHYLSDIAGLLVLSVFTKNVFKEAGDWKKFAINELRKEMFKQVYPDGTDFEASTCYHRLVLELFFYSTFFAVQNEKYKTKKEKKDLLSLLDDYKTIAQDIFGKDYVTRLYKMFDAVLYLLKPNGRMPQIGDNDNGQFIKLYPREVLDMRYLLALGAVFFKESKWKSKEFFESDEDIAEVMILYGENGIKIWDSLEENSVKNIGSKAFSDSGWYVMRNNKDYCIVSCGPNGQGGLGGHAHNDKLSFEICIDGEDIVVDPGTYVYTADPYLRNLFRGTEYHNTIYFDGVEQNKLERLFSLNRDAKSKGLYFGEKDEIVKFKGELKYKNKQVRSEFSLDKRKKSFIISFKNNCIGHFNLHFAIDINPDDYIKEGELFEYWYSPQYGEKILCIGKKISREKIFISFRLSK